MRPHRIIVNLDSLLDTRLACVLMLNKDHVPPLLEKGYLERLHNKLSLIHPPISDYHVDDLFANRDVPMLKMARSTNNYGIRTIRG